VALFGFDYDEGFLEVMGEPWPGVLEAERQLAEEADRSRRSVEDVREEKSRLYDRWLARHARDAEESEKRARAASSRTASRRSEGD
jgi:hypothetical protein